MSEAGNVAKSLRDRLGGTTEERLGKALSELLENPLLTGAIGRAFEAREKVSEAQEVAMGALNLPSAADIERLTRRLRAVSNRLEGIEDGVDRLDRALTPSGVEARLIAIEGHLKSLTGKLENTIRGGAAKATAASKPKAGKAVSPSAKPKAAKAAKRKAAKAVKPKAAAKPKVAKAAKAKAAKAAKGKAAKAVRPKAAKAKAAKAKAAAKPRAKAKAVKAVKAKATKAAKAKATKAAKPKAAKAKAAAKPRAKATKAAKAKRKA